MIRDGFLFLLFLLLNNEIEMNLNFENLELQIKSLYGIVRFVCLIGMVGLLETKTN